MHPFPTLVKSFLQDYPAFTSSVLGLKAGYTGTCKKSRKPNKKGKCKKGFDVYDRPLDDGTFQKCCFRLFKEEQSTAEVYGLARVETE